MQHTYSQFHRVGIHGVCAMAIIVLSACASHTYQEEKGTAALGKQSPYDYLPSPSVRLNQLYRLRQETTIWDQSHLPSHQRLPSDYLPYSIECRSKIFRQPCNQPSVVNLPAGTLIELVGVNDYYKPLVGTTRTLIFAVHDIPVLDTVLFQAPSYWPGTGRPNSPPDEAPGDSRWTAERLKKITGADWVRKHQVNVRRLVVAPGILPGEPK